MRKIMIVVIVAAAANACATLGALGPFVQAPRFENAPDRPAEIRLLSPSGGQGSGVGVRLWAKVTNPNPFGFTLATLDGTLFLEEARAATVVGEPLEIYPFLGSSRLEEPLVRYGVSAVFHGHAHHGQPEGRTSAGAPVYNVSLPLLQRVHGEHPYRIIEVSSEGCNR